MTRNLRLLRRLTLRLAARRKFLRCYKRCCARTDRSDILTLRLEGGDELEHCVCGAECFCARGAAGQNQDIVGFWFGKGGKGWMVGDDADVAGHAGVVSWRMWLNFEGQWG